MRKIFTFLTLFFFTANTLVWGAPMDAASLFTSVSRSGEGISIIHIQDAHSNYEAQQSIREILRNLHEKEGVSLVALEGAWTPLYPQAYHFFPDAASNLKIADYLAQKGEMSGAELYALELNEKGKSPMRFEGVEDPAVYSEDYEIFKRLLAKQNEVKTYCDELFSKLDVEKSRIYSPEFLRFDRNIRDFESKCLELTSFLRILEKVTREKMNLELTSPDHQRQWPYLCRMLRVMNAAQGLDMKAVEKDAAKLNINLNDKSLAANPREFFESIYSESVKKGISLEGYKAIRQYSEHLILKSEITGPELFAEADALIEKLCDIYASTPKEKELLARTREARLFEKILKLEATGKDWQKFKNHNDQFKNSELYSLSYKFYELAERRNQILFENMLQKMKAAGQTKAILVTGGFHSEGIAALAREKNISYRSIQPQIHEEFSNQRYRDAVLGTWWKAIASSKIAKSLGMVEMPYDPIEHAKIIKIALAQAASLGEPTKVERLRDALFDKQLALEHRRKIASDLIDLDTTFSFSDNARARERILDAITRVHSPEEAAEQLKQLSAVLAAEAETEFRQGEDDRYNRPGLDVIALSRAAEQASKLTRMVLDPARYLYEIEYPPILNRMHFAAIAGVMVVTVLAAACQSLLQVLAGAVLVGTMTLFLATVVYTAVRALFPAQNRTQSDDLENVFGPKDLEIFKDFRQKFWDGEHDFSKIEEIENVSLKLGLLSEIASAYQNGTPVSPEEIEKFKGLLNDLRRSQKPRLVSAVEQYQKFLQEKFSEGKFRQESIRKAEGASLGSAQEDPIDGVEHLLKMKWKKFFDRTWQLGSGLSGIDHENFLAARRVRLALLYYVLLGGHPFDKCFWSWNGVPASFHHLPIQYQHMCLIEWMDAFMSLWKSPVDLLQAVEQLRQDYADGLAYRVGNATIMHADQQMLISEVIRKMLPRIFREVLEDQGEPETTEFLYDFEEYLNANGVLLREEEDREVIVPPTPVPDAQNSISIKQLRSYRLSWDPQTKVQPPIVISIIIRAVIAIWNWLTGVTTRNNQIIHEHHDLFLQYLKLIQQRKNLGMPDIHFHVAWEHGGLNSYSLEDLIDGLSQYSDFVVQIVQQKLNTVDVFNRVENDESGVLKKSLLEGKAQLEIGFADSARIKIYGRQIAELKEALQLEQDRQKQFLISQGKSLGEGKKRESSKFPVKKDDSRVSGIFHVIGVNGLTNDKAWGIWNIISTPDVILKGKRRFFEDTIRNLDLKLGDRKLVECQISLISKGNKNIYKIRLITEGYKTVQFVLYQISTQQMLNEIVNGYEVAARIQKRDPQLRIFPKIGAIQKMGETHWVSVKYLEPDSVPPSLSLIIRVYFKLLEAGWTINDLFLDQVMISRPAKKAKGTLVDLDYLRRLRGEEESQENVSDLRNQIKKIFTEVHLNYGKDKLPLVAKIGSQYISEISIYQGYRRFIENVEGPAWRETENQIRKELGMPPVVGESLGIVNPDKEIVKFEEALRKGKVDDSYLRQTVDLAEKFQKLDKLKDIFIGRLILNDYDVAAQKGLKLLNACEAGYFEFTGILAPSYRCNASKSPVRSVAVSPEGIYFAFGTEDGVVHIWNIETKREVYRFEEKGFHIRTIAFNSSGKQIRAEGIDNSFRNWLLMGPGQKQAFPSQHLPGRVIHDFDTRPVELISPDSRRRIELTRSGDLKVCDWNEKSLIRSREIYEISGKQILCVDISPDSRYFVTGSRDGRVIVWDLQTDKPFMRAFLAGHDSSVYSVKFGSDGRWVISAGEDQSVKLWMAHERKLKGFWSRFKEGFGLNDVELKQVQDYIDNLNQPANYPDRTIVEAWIEQWQKELLLLIEFRAIQLARDHRNDPHWKNEPLLWFRDALIEALKPGSGAVSMKTVDALERIESEMRVQLTIPRPRPPMNNSWNDAQNILLIFELLRNYQHVFKVPDMELPESSGLSLGEAHEADPSKLLAELKKIFIEAAAGSERAKIIDAIQLGDLKYPKAGLMVSGDQLGNPKFSSENLYGISIPEDAGGYSGDILEAFIKDDELHLIVADAIGHDLAASFNRYLFQQLAKQYPLEAVHEIFRDWHTQVRYLMRHEKENHEWPFLSFGLRYFELKMNLFSRKVSVRTATGVNDQLVEGPKGRMNQMEILGSPGAHEQMIGMMTEGGQPAVFPWRELILKEGFLILLQTDGAYEARNAEKTELELERVKSVINEVLQKNPDASAKEVVERILDEVKTHLGSAPLSDDITLLAFRVPKPQPKIQGRSLGINEQKDFDKFQEELKKGKVTEQRLKDIVDRAEASKQFDYLRNIFLARLIVQDIDIYAHRGLKLLNAREAAYREFFGLSVPARVFDGGAATVRAVAVSPDGKRFASGTSEGLVKVWDAETGRMVFRFEEKAFPIKSLKFSPNGLQIRAEGADFSSRIWILNTGQKLMVPAPPEMERKFFDPDIRPIDLVTLDGRRKIAVNRMGDLDVWQWDEKNSYNRKVIYGIRGRNIFSADISADGRYFVTGDRDGRVIIWDFGTNYPHERAILAGYETYVFSVKFSPDSKWIIAGSQDHTMKVWKGHERKLDGFWSRFKSGFDLTDEDVRGVQDFISSLDPRQGNLNYEERAQLEAYAIKWQQDFTAMVRFQAESLARQPGRDPKWKDDPLWLAEAVDEFLRPSSGVLSAYSMDKLEQMEKEMRVQLKISKPRSIINTYWNDAQNILLVLELIRRHDHIFKLPKPELPKASGASLGVVNADSDFRQINQLIEASPFYQRLGQTSGFAPVMTENDLVFARLIHLLRAQRVALAISKWNRIGDPEKVKFFNMMYEIGETPFSHYGRVAIRELFPTVNSRRRVIVRKIYNQILPDIHSDNLKAEFLKLKTEVTALALRDRQALRTNEAKIVQTAHEVVDKIEDTFFAAKLGWLTDPEMKEAFNRLFPNDLLERAPTLTDDEIDEYVVRLAIAFISKHRDNSGLTRSALEELKHYQDRFIVPVIFKKQQEVYDANRIRKILETAVRRLLDQGKTHDEAFFELLKTSDLDLTKVVGQSLGAAQIFSGGIYPFWMYTSLLYPKPAKTVSATGGFSVSIKTSDNFNLAAEKKYLLENPRAVSVVLDRTGKIQTENRFIVVPLAAGKESAAIRSVLAGKVFVTIKKLAQELYEKPGVRLTQSALQKRMTVEAPASFLNKLGPIASAQLLEIPSQDELAAMHIAPQELSAYALVHAALLGRVEGNLNDPLIKPFRTNIERDSITGTYRLIRNSLVERIALLEASIVASQKILAAA